MRINMKGSGRLWIHYGIISILRDYGKAERLHGDMIKRSILTVKKETLHFTFVYFTQEGV